MSKETDLQRIASTLAETQDILREATDAIRATRIQPPPFPGSPLMVDLIHQLHAAKQHAERERNSAFVHAQNIEGQLQDTIREMEYLQRENKSLLEQMGVLTSSNTDEEKEEETPLEFKTVLEATEKAQQMRGLRFLPDAIKSAADSPYEFPMKVYQAFVLLSQLASLRMTGDVGMSIKDWLAAAGVEYSPHLGNARDHSKYKQQYMFKLNGIGGERVVFEEHLKFGNARSQHHGLRIYMKWHDNEWVIGYIGHHLRNSTT